jgi:hypothetical protein
MKTRLAAALATLLAISACGRAGPGATLTRRKDPDVPAHDVQHKECVDLRQGTRGVRRGRTIEPTETFECRRWKWTGVDHIAATSAPTYERGQGPAPLLSVIPSAGVGASVGGSGQGHQGGLWIDAAVQLHLIPGFDRISAYASAGFLGITNQSDLSGIDAGGGVVLALTGSWSLEGHGGIVLADASPWRAGGGLRFRPKHRTSRDWAVSLSVEHIAGDDARTETVPVHLVANHSTGLVLGISGGWIR